MALAVSVVVYAACGFALMYASPQSLFAIPTASGQRWLLAGSNGFFLEGVSSSVEALGQFVESAPLVLAAAILLAGALAHRMRTLGVALAVFAVCGLVLPLAGCWIWGGGWLQSLAAASGLGTSTPDLGRLATVGVIAGVTGTLVLLRSPLRTPPVQSDLSSPPELPAVELPVRAVAGVLCVLAASASFTHTAASDLTVLAQFVNTSIVVSVAIIVAGAYAAFTTRRPEALSAARAALAAVFMASAGGAATPVWLCIALGAGCGLLATVGFYWVNETRRLCDEHALITSVLVPSAAGFLVAGLVRGSESNLVDGASLLTLQVITLAVIAGLAWIVALGILVLAERLRWDLRPMQPVQPLAPFESAPVPIAIAATPTTNPASALDVTVTTLATPTTLPIYAPAANAVEVTQAVNTAMIHDTQLDAQPLGPTDKAVPSADEEAQPIPVSESGALAASTAPITPMTSSETSASAATETPQSRIHRRTRLANLLARLRGTPVETPSKPPRRVAYPYRAGGRRMTSRPLTAGLGEPEHGPGSANSAGAGASSPNSAG